MSKTKVNFTELLEKDLTLHGNNWDFSFLIHVMTEHAKSALDWEKEFGIRPHTQFDPPTMIDVDVTINGVSVPA